MKEYLNLKQLYFLLFLAALYGIGLLMRSGDTGKKSTVTQVVSNSYQADFRSRPFRLSPLAACQQSCRKISDSSLVVLIAYGAVGREQGDSIRLQGKSLTGEDLWLDLLLGDTLLIDRILSPYSSSICDCP